MIGEAPHVAAEPARPLVQDIQNAVAREFRVAMRDLMSTAHAHWLAHPRQVAMVLAVRLSGQSKAAIGRRFSRDHATVMWAEKSLARRMERDRELAVRVERLEAAIKRKAELDAKHPPCSCSACRNGARAFPGDPPQLRLPIAGASA